MANLGLQNKNPGNLRDPATGDFRVFNSDEEGRQALLADIQAKQSGNSSYIKPGASLSDFAKVWAPASDNNDPTNYANTLATHLGVDASHPFDQVDPNQLADAIQVAEGTSTPNTATSKSTVKLSREQITANIDAMEKQGASQEDIQGYLDSLKGSSNTPTKAPLPNPSGTGIDLSNPNVDSMAIAGGTQRLPGANTPGTLRTLANVGKGLISGTIEAGSDIAAAIGGNTMMKPFNDLAQSDQDNLTKFIHFRNEAAKNGNKDLVAHYQNLIKNYKTVDNTSAAELFPALNKSTEQVLGDFASLGLETVGLAAGASGVADLVTGAGAKGVTESFGKRLLNSSLSGAKYGAGFGTAGAMQNNEGIKDTAESAVGGAVGGAVLGAATEAIGSGVSRAFGGGKTAEELAQIPEKDVANLSLREQKEWYRQQSDLAKENASKLTIKTKELGEQSVKQISDEIVDFNQKIGETARDKAVQMKPQARQLMRDASDEYLSLTGEAVKDNPALTKTIGSEDLASKIDSKFGEYDPGVAASLKSELGLTAETKDVSNQEILDKARSIMEGVSKSAKSGGKVYSPEEYEAMKKYSFLMETIGDNGVDMKPANDFWSKWSKVRNRIYNEIKPFDTENTGKIPFANTLNKAESTAKTAQQTVAKLDAQNFIGELETRMKLPKGSIGEDTRKLVGELEQSKLNKENMEKVIKDTLEQVKLDKAESLKTMKLSQYNAETKAQKAARIKKALLVVLGLSAVSSSIPVVKTVLKAL